MFTRIEAVSSIRYTLACAYREDVYPHNLIRNLVLQLKNSWTLGNPQSTYRRLRSDYADAQADLISSFRAHTNGYTIPAQLDSVKLELCKYELFQENKVYSANLLYRWSTEEWRRLHKLRMCVMKNFLYN